MVSIFSVALWLGLAAVPPVQPDVTIYRSWRAPDFTVVEGMFRVDPALLGTTDCVYGVELVVKDSAGTSLRREEWRGSCPEEGGRISAALETFSFAMPATVFTVDVTVYAQSQPANRHSRTIEVQALEGTPVASDLILAREVGYIDSANSDQWTLRRGEIGVLLSSAIVVQPDDPGLGYYVEVYGTPSDPVTGSVVGVVRRLDGRELARFPLSQVAELQQSQPVAGTVSVAGLPPGDYTFEIQLTLADSTAVRAHPFTVASTADAAVAAGGWFYTIPDDRLSELFDAVELWLTPSEATMYAALPPSGKREFLTRQFGSQGPTPDDGQESALDNYLTRIEIVNVRFVERADRGVRGAWQTARGRMYMLLGEPTSRITRPSPHGGAPYEIWHYATGRGMVYLFADDTRMGNYRLLFTNDPNQQSVPNWQTRLSSEAIEDLERFGVRVSPDGGGSSL